jgi:stage V sporulation protein S
MSFDFDYLDKSQLRKESEGLYNESTNAFLTGRCSDITAIFAPINQMLTCLTHSTPTRGVIMDVIKVSARSRPPAVAGAIAGVIREHKYAIVQAIGAGAVNQAIKAVIIAGGYLKEDGIPIHCLPQFIEIQIDGQERTAIKFVVEPCSQVASQTADDNPDPDAGPPE